MSVVERPRGRVAPDARELRDWTDSLDEVVARAGPGRAKELLAELQIHALRRRIVLPTTSQTPYVNTIDARDEPLYPGDLEIEGRIKSLVRWNAMAMVVRANRASSGIGGHISTYASAATLYEVALHHVLRGRDDPSGGDHVYFQGHASPGVYARAFLEGRLSEGDLERFRRELDPRGGLPSYPHPRAMPDFWEFPTVSMGLGPIMAIYRARFQRYLQHRGLRGLREPSGARTWCFVGDGECDEPETLGSISVAAREGLDNLVFVVNCNLQRLDGPVRGNGKIVQELEAIFRGVGWNVIKVLWGGEWDERLAEDHDGRLARRMGAALDGDYLKYHVAGGAYVREHFWGSDPVLAERVRHLSDDELWRMSLGGHDPLKVHAAYAAAVRHEGAPTVVLARTIKGYGLGEAGEGRNVTHQQKKLNEEELLYFRDRFDIPIPKQRVGEAPFFRPAADSPEIEYLLDRRRELGGPCPRGILRTAVPARLPVRPDPFAELLEGTGEREATTTMALVRLLSRLVREDAYGERVVPIIPDEARTFGLDALFRQCGIYSSMGQLYEPVDAANVLFYREAKDGQILEEGITEAGAMSSFIAAGTSGAAHGTPTVPFYLFYSMFGFQRVGDLIWAAADARTRGFLVGATSGRTTLAGEGLQHQDGQSHLLALPVPGLRAYDPAFAYEIAVIVQDGLERMLERGEDALYYLTVTNEGYPQPPLPDDAETAREGCLRGLYRVRASERAPDAPRVVLLGSGALLRSALAAGERLERDFDVAAETWSVTSAKLLYEDALAAERWTRLHPGEPPRVPYVAQRLGGRGQACVAVCDYVRALLESIARFLPGEVRVLGTDGFGRSDARPELRDWFEVDDRYVAAAALEALSRAGELDPRHAARALGALGIDPERAAPHEF